MNLTIQQDGTCRFWGYYTNRGDTFLFTAPPQDFAVAMVVYDLYGAGYAFCYGGFVWSAPQPGCTDTWDFTQQSQVIADNWNRIACGNQATDWCSNQPTEAAGPDGNWAPDGTGDTILGLIQSAVAGASAVVWPILGYMGSIPYGMAASGDDGPPIGGITYVPGWNC